MVVITNIYQDGTDDRSNPNNLKKMYLVFIKIILLSLVSTKNNQNFIGNTCMSTLNDISIGCGP